MRISWERFEGGFVMFGVIWEWLDMVSAVLSTIWGRQRTISGNEQQETDNDPPFAFTECTRDTREVRMSLVFYTRIYSLRQITICRFFLSRALASP